MKEITKSWFYLLTIAATMIAITFYIYNNELTKALFMFLFLISHFIHTFLQVYENKKESVHNIIIGNNSTIDAKNNE